MCRAHILFIIYVFFFFFPAVISVVSEWIHHHLLQVGVRVMGPLQCGATVTLRPPESKTSQFFNFFLITLNILSSDFCQRL